MFGRWFSFPIGWFLGSMLIFRGVVAKVTGMMVTPEVLCQEARVTFQQHFDALRWGPKIFLPPKIQQNPMGIFEKNFFLQLQVLRWFWVYFGSQFGVIFLVPFPVQRRGWHSTLSQMFNHQRGGGETNTHRHLPNSCPRFVNVIFLFVVWRVFSSTAVILIQSMPGVFVGTKALKPKGGGGKRVFKMSKNRNPPWERSNGNFFFQQKQFYKPSSFTGFLFGEIFEVSLRVYDCIPWKLTWKT